MEKKDAVAIVASKAAGEKEEYVQPENPYVTSIVDKELEVLTSDVDSEDESLQANTRHVLRRLQSGQYDAYFVGDVYKCPFCNRRLGATNFKCLVHAEYLSSSRPKVVEFVNINAFIAHHKALGIHLRNLLQMAIVEGRMPPIKLNVPKIKGMGSRKWRKRQREEAEARGWG